MNASPQTYLAFLHNSLTGEDFIAPALGANSAEATAQLRETYPSAVYGLQTLYPAEALKRYMADLDRWPGMPSRVQPKLADLMATQRIRTQMGGLPPLQKNLAATQAPPAGLSAAQFAQLKTIAKGMPAETQALAARLLAGGISANQSPAATVPAAPKLAPPVVEAPVAVAAPQPAAQPSSQPITRAPMTMQAALQSLRASGATGASVSQTTATPRLSPGMYPTSAKVTQTAAAPLPASARGVQGEEGAPTANAFAVGKVSAISVLKALRARG